MKKGLLAGRWLAREEKPANDRPPELYDQGERIRELTETRNALKQELDHVAGERDRLREEVIGLRQRSEDVERILSGLEGMLSDPGRAMSAIVYYQLRDLWRHCRGMLDAARRELAARHEQQERDRLLTEYRARQEAEEARLKQQINARQVDIDRIEARQRDLEQQLRNRTKLWHFFIRKRLLAELEQVRQGLDPLLGDQAETQRQLREVEEAEPPRYPGLSLAARRSINLMLIALAQDLYLHFYDDSLGTMARTAHLKPVGECHFGSPDECTEIVEQVKKALTRLRAEKNHREKVAERLKYLRGKISYAGERDTVPKMDGIEYIPRVLKDQSEVVDSSMQPLPANLMELGYWDLDELVLR
ncbi:MAG: hypothetical protein PVJ40_04495 [Gammaproteobacteria bacterium]|jgi:hypothetical protein